MKEEHQNRVLTPDEQKRILTTDYDPSHPHMTLTPKGIVRGCGITELSLRTEIGSILNSINGGTRLVNQVKANEHKVAERSVIDMVINAEYEYSINFNNEDYCILGVRHEIIHVTSHMLGCMVTGTLFKKNKEQDISLHHQQAILLPQQTILPTQQGIPQQGVPFHPPGQPPQQVGSFIPPIMSHGGRKRIKRSLRRSLRSNRRNRTKQTRSRSK